MTRTELIEWIAAARNKKYPKVHFEDGFIVACNGLVMRYIKDSGIKGAFSLDDRELKMFLQLGVVRPDQQVDYPAEWRDVIRRAEEGDHYMPMIKLDDQRFQITYTGPRDKEEMDREGYSL